MKEYYDVIIVGTGAAGLYCALNLPERKRILLITKQEADQSDSFLAQGGICMLRGEDDYQNYFEDTMRAGHYENNARAVDLMIRSSNSIIRDLVERKVDFTRDETGNLMFTREAAHSQPRILFHEDITGKQITQTLLNEAKTKENIEICEYMTMVVSSSWIRKTMYILCMQNMWFWPVADSADYIRIPQIFRTFPVMHLELL